MELKLIDGDFNQIETIDLLTQLYQVKIKFHEEKVKNSHNEEDIKMREQKIKYLQNNLAEARTYIKNENKNFHIDSVINI
jgi:Spy/CpxP family protein refolding chaperone